jgi:hypothetical protein
MKSKFSWQGFWNALDRTTWCKRYEVSLSSSGGGRIEPFWFRRNALAYYEAHRKDDTWVTVTDMWWKDEHGCSVEIARTDNEKRFAQLPPERVSAMLRRHLPDPANNAYGLVLTREGHVPLICGHGGSAWLCLNCAEEMGKREGFVTVDLNIGR